MAIATAAQMKQYLRVITGTTEDSLLDALILRFDRIGSSYCGFPTNSNLSTFENNTYTHYFDEIGRASCRERV